MAMTQSAWSMAIYESVRYTIREWSNVIDINLSLMFKEERSHIAVCRKNGWMGSSLRYSTT